MNAANPSLIPALALLVGSAWAFGAGDQAPTHSIPACDPSANPTITRTLLGLMDAEGIEATELLASRSQSERLAILRVLAARETADATYQALGLVLELDVPAGHELLRRLVARGLAEANDAQLASRALALEARIDPARHEERVLALCRCIDTPMGLLVGAVSSLEDVSPDAAERVLRALLATQIAALADHCEGAERAQREELALGALTVIGRSSRANETTSLLETGQEARRLLAGLTLRQGNRQELYRRFTRMPHGLARWNVAEAFERVGRAPSETLLVTKG